MKQVTAQSKKQKKQTANFAKGLGQEAVELETLHKGLLRHLAAWRTAHDTTVAHIAAHMARTDAILERIERNRLGRG
ncbi:MAG: hypothetical protein HOP13_04295 [Alphaproteobacteria bacterium]|nr:hypothetical protein [Alphaproteobacteria bacterium]